MARVNDAPGAPTPVSPAEGHGFAHGDPQTFALSAVDPDGDPYTATVTIRDGATNGVVATMDTTPAPSGDVSHAVRVPPLPEGTYTWSAQARDVLHVAGPESPTRTFHVGRPAVVGSGKASGRLAYAEPGIPAGSCVATAFDVQLDAQTAIVDAAIVGYVGPLQLAGSGTSACEDRSMGSGPLTLSVTGTSLTQSTMSCPALSGSFTRVGVVFTGEVAGGCHINAFPTGRTTWTVTASAVPMDATNGTNAPYRDVKVDGALAVRSLRQQ